MLYVKMNTGRSRKHCVFTEREKEEFQKHRQEEYALYRHFLDIFGKKVDAEDATFPEEVAVFQRMRSTVESYCTEAMGNRTTAELTVEATKFSESFRVTYEDCTLLTRESSSVKDVWFEKLMIKRINKRSHWCLSAMGTH